MQSNGMRALLLTSGLFIILFLGLYFMKFQRENRRKVVDIALKSKDPLNSAILSLRDPIKPIETKMAIRTTTQLIIKPSAERPYVKPGELVFEGCDGPDIVNRAVLLWIDGEFVISAEDLRTSKDLTDLAKNCRVKGGKYPKFQTLTVPRPPSKKS